jgi:hypothetical protein
LAFSSLFLALELVETVVAAVAFAMDQDRQSREGLAHRLVGISFFLFAVYVAFEAGKSLPRHEEPETSVVGSRVAAKLDSRALRADSRQTDIYAYLSAILLVGLLLNALFSWWWADPIAALCMLPLIFREGIEAVRDRLSCHHESFQFPK